MTDDTKVETGVQLVERWCLAPLRNHTFFSLAELNRELRTHLDALNERPFQKLPGTRQLLQQTIDRRHELRLTGMAQALGEQRGQPDLHDLALRIGSRYSSSAKQRPGPIAD